MWELFGLIFSHLKKKQKYTNNMYVIYRIKKIINVF